MLVLLVYPFILKWFVPSSNVTQPVTEQQSESVTPTEVATPKTETFIDQPEPPAIVRYENNLFEIEFSTLGGTVSRLFFKDESSSHVDTSTLFYQGEMTRPGLFGTNLLHDNIDLTQSIFKLNRRTETQNVFEFVFEKPNEYRLIKAYTVDDQKPVVHLKVTFENLSKIEKHFPLKFDYGLEYKFSEGITDHHFESVAWTDKVESANLGKISKKGWQISKNISWAGEIKKYYAVLIKPDWTAIGLSSQSEEPVLWSTLSLEPISVQAGQKSEHSFLIFAGPQRYELLKSFGVGFEDLLSKGFFGMFKIWLLLALKFCNQWTHNFGWSIILLTVVIKLAFTPLTHMSFESMKKMQALQPKVKSLQERYKSDASKLNRELMELYKRNKVNPMMGCLPMVIQIPVFIAFYQVLSETIELKGAPFMFWINDLSEPDRLFTFPFSIPFLGDSFHLLPILMLISMIWQQKLTPQAGGTPEQAKMMAFMPIIFGFIFYKMPSGLVLYWFVNNMLSIIHQVFVKRMAVVLHHEDRE